jgi:hypothetical protein
MPPNGITALVSGISRSLRARERADPVCLIAGRWLRAATRRQLVTWVDSCHVFPPQGEVTRVTRHCSLQAEAAARRTSAAAIVRLPSRMEASSDGIAAALPGMQKRGPSRSRAGGRMVLVEAVA